MTDEQFAALLMRTQCARREYVRDWYARALADWQQTRRLWPSTYGPDRGRKMLATYQLKKADKELSRLITEG